MENFDVGDEDCCMRLYDSIFIRRSVRDYSFENLPEKNIDSIKNAIEGTKDLGYSTDPKISLVQDGEKFADRISGIVGNYGKVRAPYYLALTAEEKDGRFAEVGYVAEQLVLHMTGLDIGTCWIGKGASAKILTEFTDLPEDHKFTAMIAFGYPEGEKQLKKKSRWKRKDLDELLLEKKTENLDRPWRRVLEAARVAPSAVNSQPWRFDLNEDTLHLYTVKRNKLTNLVTGNLENMNKIDGGIALLHLQVAAKTLAEDAEAFISSAEGRRGLNYTGSLKIEKE